MNTLNLKRLWEVMNIINEVQEKLGDEQGKYVALLGFSSTYFSSSFEQFLEGYSFKIDGDTIIVYNNDPVAYQDFNNDDFSYVPDILLSFLDREIQEWIEEETEKQLKQQEEDKAFRKDNLQIEIERLKRELERL